VIEFHPLITQGCSLKLNGAEGIRTPDLLRAREALSQLSYSPTLAIARKPRPLLMFLEWSLLFGF
jgi:hypothetical protein